jgi:hypothetical protein
MKNLKLMFALCFFAVTLVAQQVDRDKVIIESATGTW